MPPRAMSPMTWHAPSRARTAVGEGERAERERSATRRDDDVWPFSLAESYGISTWLITCTMPFEAEMSVAPRPAAESCSRVSFEPFSIT